MRLVYGIVMVALMAPGAQADSFGSCAAISRARKAHSYRTEKAPHMQGLFIGFSRYLSFVDVAFCRVGLGKSA